MKYFIFIFFFVFSFTAFSANTVSEVSLEVSLEVPLEVLDTLDPVEIETELKVNSSNENAVAFECYYTVEWLYTDSPFIKKLDALA